MTSNIVDAYYDKMKKNIIEYATILINRAFRIEKLSTKIYVNIINHYVDYFNCNAFKISDEVNDFINRHNVRHFRLNNIINHTILFINKADVRYNIEQNADLIIKLAKILLVAIEIQIKTDVLMNVSVKYANILDNIIRENAAIFDAEVKTRIKDVEKEIKEKIKKNISISKKFLATVKNNNFYLTYFNINEQYTLTRFSYDIKALNKYLKSDVEDQIIKKELSKKFVIIQAELLSLLIMKWFFAKKEKRIFFIQIPPGFIQEQEPLIKLIDKLSNRHVLPYVCLQISYSDVINNKQIVQQLKNRHLAIAVVNAEKINEHKEYNTFNELIDYLFGNEILKSNNEYPREFCRSTNVKYIDTITQQEKYITEDAILFS